MRLTTGLPAFVFGRASSRRDGQSAADRPESALRDKRPGKIRRGAMVRARKLSRSFTRRLSSSLTRRIVVLNLGGLVALLVLFLYLNQFREGLIDARVQSLQTQGQVIAAAIAASATVGTDTITVDPEKLLQLAPGQSAAGTDEDGSSLEFSINPERVGPVLRSLVSPTRTRARIYDVDGELLVDSRSLSLRGSILKQDLAPPPDPGEGTLIERTWSEVKRRFGHTGVPLVDDSNSTKATAFPEVGSALKGDMQSIVRVNRKGQTIVSVAVPIKHYRTIRGALLLSTQGGDIDAIIASERYAILRVFLVAATVTLVLSLLLANTIADPIRRLAEAADRVRRGVNSRELIPDFTARSDEIGHLSGALRDMTKALFSRMDATESFAADVAHELKNPLTSLRSAVETLPRIKAEESRDRLISVIQHDIRRLDRLISDISDASRLDAELARGGIDAVDLQALLTAVVAVANGVNRNDEVTIELAVDPGTPATHFWTDGHDSRLGQVFNNLVDNARSFSPHGGAVRVALRHMPVEDEEDDTRLPGLEVVVDDDGPGIPAHAFERIFERFYTDRPEHGFGQNSGLGLSISRQIVDAHGGRIWAVNRLGAAGADGEPVVEGARFTVQLPASRRR